MGVSKDRGNPYFWKHPYNKFNNVCQTRVELTLGEKCHVEKNAMLKEIMLKEIPQRRKGVRPLRPRRFKTFDIGSFSKVYHCQYIQQSLKS